MKPVRLSREPKHPNRAPLWQWIIIILIAIAMPLFFSYYRSVQMQNAISQLPPEQTTQQQPKDEALHRTN